MMRVFKAPEFPEEHPSRSRRRNQSGIALFPNNQYICTCPEGHHKSEHRGTSSPQSELGYIVPGSLCVFKGPLFSCRMETKTCSTCLQEKPISEFYAQPGHKYGVMSLCKECFNKFCAERWKQRKIRYIKQFGGKCQSCGLELTDNNYCVFDFHHTDPQEKEYMWTKLRLFSDSRIQEELAKCILLCANCHRMAHHDQ